MLVPEKKAKEHFIGHQMFLKELTARKNSYASHIYMKILYKNLYTEYFHSV